MRFLRFIMKKLLTLCFFIFALALFSASAQTFNYEIIAPHPRLLLTKGDITKMRELPSTSANAKAVHNRIIAVADSYLSAEPIKREKGASREALKRIFHLSYAHLTTDDMRYVAAAEREMLAASAFEDWNPSHFLDVAEMTMALAIGYDWLYRRLSVHSRSIIGTAIYEKGLLASEDTRLSFWNATNNWNSVCNAGMIYGALATLERAPEYCKALIAKCVESNKNALKIYEPDGAYPEGYGHWAYGSGFEAMLAAALESSLGDDAGISAQKSFMRSAEFMNHLVAPSGYIYNYGDCNEAVAGCLPAKYWFARKAGDTSLVAIDEKLLSEGNIPHDDLLPLYMINAIAMDLSKAAQLDEKVWYSTGEVPMFIYRSGWNQGDTFFAIKGGKAATSHAHMDAGSFVYELNGVRWVIDLGDENDENLTAAGIDVHNMDQTSNRWSAFRLGADSHNTLTFKGARHNVNGKAEITSHEVTNRDKHVTINLSPVFEPYARSAHRSAHLDKKNNLTIIDQIENSANPSTVEWHITTCADAEIVSPNTILLKQKDKTLYIKLKTRSNAIAKIWNQNPAQSYESSNEGVRRVGFSIELKGGEDATFEVQFSPTKPNVISRIKQTLKIG